MKTTILINIRLIFLKLLVMLIIISMISCLGKSSVYQATGIKIGEVTDSSAIIWARVTRYAERAGKESPRPQIQYFNPDSGTWFAKVSGRPDMMPKVIFPESSNIETIEGAVPGADGQVRILYKSNRDQDWQSSNWVDVDPERDYTCQLKLDGLQPDMIYRLKVEAENGPATEGEFRTAPAPDVSKKVVFTVTTGQAYGDQDTTAGYKIYPQMLKLNPDFFVHTGDILYYDYWAKSEELARWGWARMYSLPTNVYFHRHVASYFIKDDHDTWMDDCWPGMPTKFMGEFTFAQGQQIFLEQVPMGERTFRTVRWGKDLQIWLVEGRDFRSPNTMPDGPDKTIWGKEQKEWFKNTVQTSEASFKILFSPTPIVGPDRPRKNDNHANSGFASEGTEIRQFIARQKNMVVICGDRHWQYVSVDAETGIREYSCGPASNKHAGGWKPDDIRPEHRYLNVIGGFLSGVVESDGLDIPTLTLRHYSVDGQTLNEDILGFE